ncbi:MAG TPA: hypothetical protein VEK76_05575 [Candidatus Binatia bacterium]|nr:hypothetical protein [Candidatus Binatia bacterium]
MATHICFDTPNVVIRWEGDAGYLVIEYRHWFDAAQCRDAIMEFPNAVKEHRATRCLSDSRLRRVVQPDVQELYTETGIPQAAAFGLKRLAIVIPQSVVAQATVLPMVAKYREHLEAEVFVGVEEAVAWLCSDQPELAPLSGEARNRPAGPRP